MARFSRDSKIAFVGSGVVGGSLAVVLSQAGYPVVATASRTFSSAQNLARFVPGCVAYETAQEAANEADFVFITTPDDVIGAVAASISWRQGQGVAHCSGA
ncbi:MAG: NAD(P)-binding domain-containing protein, partial [Chloroflexi bacterium]|nr:NAD(P)-binding domain-containing protein [Chloroflexota bacterium]